MHVWLKVIEKFGNILYIALSSEKGQAISIKDYEWIHCFQLNVDCSILAFMHPGNQKERIKLRNELIRNTYYMYTYIFDSFVIVDHK